MALKPNYYETLYVVRPDLKEEELEKIQSKLPQFIDSHEGEIMRSDKWADRELAYEIQDHKRGTYYILVFKALPTAMKEIEKHLRFYNTDVLRFMTVKIEEEQALREKNSAEAKTEKAPLEEEQTPPKAESAQPASEASAQEPAKTDEPAAPASAQETATTDNSGSEPEAEVKSEGGNE